MEVKDWIKDAIDLYNKDYSYLRIGRALNVDRKRVAIELKKLGYLPKYSFVSRNGVNREFDIWRKYNFNEDFFEKIDTEEKAYWLGYSYADGYVSSTKSSYELYVQERDLEHLKKFQKSINSNHKLTTHRKKMTYNGKEREYIGYRLTLNSEKFKHDLIKKGCVENKSKILKFPSFRQVPKRLQHHFIRGYIDGDGCWSVKKKLVSLEVIGTQDFLEGIIKSLNMHTNTIHNLKGKNNDTGVKRINYSGEYSYKIFNMLYKDATIYMDRKYKKAKLSCRLNPKSNEGLRELE